jgi:hypothetical protein
VVFSERVVAAGVAEVERRPPADGVAQVELRAPGLVLEREAGRLVCHAGVHGLAGVVPAFFLRVDGVRERLGSADAVVQVLEVEGVTVRGGVVFVHFVVAVERDVVAVKVGSVVAVERVRGAGHQEDLVVLRGACRVVRPDLGGRVGGREVRGGCAARDLQVEGDVEVLVAGVGGRAEDQVLLRGFDVVGLVGGLLGASAAALHVQLGRFRVVVVVVLLDLLLVDRMFFVVVVAVVVFGEFPVVVAAVVVMIVVVVV